MLLPVECISLRTVRLSDSKNLLSVWSRQAGRLTFAVPAGNSREARRRRAFTSPLGTFEGVCDLRPDRDIQSVRDVMPMPGSIAMGGTPLHGLTAFFLADALDVVLRRSAPDEALSDFLFDSLAVFAALGGRAAANFHLLFLFGLAHYAGIEPDTGDYAPGRVFDMREGRFRLSAPLHSDYIEGREARLMVMLSRATYASAAHLPFDRDGRRRALDLILQYFTLHLAPLNKLKSLDILRSI